MLDDVRPHQVVILEAAFTMNRIILNIVYGFQHIYEALLVKLRAG
jgi:hypothetical protein